MFRIRPKFPRASNLSREKQIASWLRVAVGGGVILGLSLLHSAALMRCYPGTTVAPHLETQIGTCVLAVAAALCLALSAFATVFDVDFEQQGYRRVRRIGLN